MVSIRPYWLNYRSAMSSVIDFGGCFENTATPEQPAECLEKLKQLWQPLRQIGATSQDLSSILVSVMQMMSGFRLLMQGLSMFLEITERSPLTFQLQMISFWGNVPSPQVQRCRLVFIYCAMVSMSSSLNILARDLTVFYFCGYLILIQEVLISLVFYSSLI